MYELVINFRKLQKEISFYLLSKENVVRAGLKLSLSVFSNKFSNIAANKSS